MKQGLERILLHMRKTKCGLVEDCSIGWDRIGIEDGWVPTEDGFILSHNGDKVLGLNTLLVF